MPLLSLRAFVAYERVKPTYYSSADSSGRFQLDSKSRKTFNIIVYTKYVFLKVTPNWARLWIVFWVFTPC